MLKYVHLILTHKFDQLKNKNETGMYKYLLKQFLYSNFAKIEMNAFLNYITYIAILLALNTSLSLMMHGTMNLYF